MTTYQYDFPTRIQFGPGSVALLGGALKEVGKIRPLLVTDRGLAGLPAITETSERLVQEGLEPSVFGGVFGNPVKSQVTAGVEAYRAHGADSVVGIGGGAAIDVAKAILLMAYHPGDLFEYEDEKPGARPIDGEIPYFVTVPTTAGTGSEVGRSTVISDEETHVKKIVFSPRLLAQRVFLDPELSLGLPAVFTASTGMDALTHLVEAYLAKGVQPMCDGIALEGVRLVARGLSRAVSFARRIGQGEKALLTDTDHLEARGQMLNAAMMGGVAFQKGLGVTHSMAHALSTVCDLHHGLANGIAIPYAMEFNASVAADRLADLARAAGAKQTDAAGFVAWLTELRAAIDIPETLREVGVTEAHVPRLVEIAVADACHPNNPRVVSEADFRALFTKALG
jgi:hypothetical protein